MTNKNAEKKSSSVSKEEGINICEHVKKQNYFDGKKHLINELSDTITFTVNNGSLKEGFSHSGSNLLLSNDEQ